MASTLYLQLPAKAVIDAGMQWEEFLFPYCLASTEKNILQQGRLSLAALLLQTQDAAQVVILLSASDVTMLKLVVPPMPFAKLKLAMPNLLEEQLLTDPAELLFVASPPVDGACVVAVVARDWMVQLTRLCEHFGSRKISAYSIAQGLPITPDQTSLLIETTPAAGLGFDICAQGNEQLAAGFYLDIQHSRSDHAAHQTLLANALQLLVPQGALNLYVEAELTPALQTVQHSLADREIQIFSADWKTKLTSLSTRSLDLLSGLRLEGKTTFDWPRWRWSIAMFSSAILLCLIGLNWEWWSLQRESDAVRASLMSTYKTSFPNDRVIRDPLVQMQQKMNTAKKLTGQSSDDDFLVLSGQFAQVWDQTVGVLPSAGVVTVEYHEHSLFVTPKNIAEVSIDRLRAGLQERHLRLNVNEGVLKITVDAGGAQ